MLNNFKNKKVLVFGLGLLGGGVATTNWLLKHGAKVTVTDLKTKEQLAPSLKRIKGKVVLRLGGHSEKDIRANDVIVFNPDISVKSPYVALAWKLKKHVENEATIFYERCAKPIIAVTGTRGKTTTATWIQHLLGKTSILAGNRYDHAFLDELDKVLRYRTVVNELPSYQLEFFPFTKYAPHIAVITNISRDHMNRYGGSLKEYAATKGNIFYNQSAANHLILNRDDAWTKFFLKQKPNAAVWFFSLRPLRKNENGMFVKDSTLYFQDSVHPLFERISRHAVPVLSIPGFVKKWGAHNVQNFMAAALAAHVTGAGWEEIAARMKTLPGVEFREQIVFKNERLTIVNDTTATSAEGGIAAVERFALPRRSVRAKAGSALPQCILIAGGTDRGLEYGGWAKAVRKKIAPKNLILLSGSATNKMMKKLGAFTKGVIPKETLEECFDMALVRSATYRNATIVFSPAAKSFEKFRNEYDRGERFNALVKNFAKKGRR